MTLHEEEKKYPQQSSAIVMNRRFRKMVHQICNDEYNADTIDNDA
jgi:hypothetical protein